MLLLCFFCNLCGYLTHIWVLVAPHRLMCTAFDMSDRRFFQPNTKQIQPWMIIFLGILGL